MCPPWKAVHFPSTYGDNKPCKNKIITVCGFDLNERSCLKQMIVAIGARYTTYLSRHNHLLIAKCLEGQKVLKAVEWKIPIVNVQWLTELFLGQTSVLQNINNAKYRQFIPKDNPQSLYDPFRIDAAMAAPVLMNAWRIPVPCTQETWKAANERRKKLNSDDGKLSPYKKLKLSPAPNDEEIENHRKECMLNSKPVDAKVCFTGLYKAEAENLKRKFFWLGGNVVDHVSECTHLIASDLKRTKKLLEGISLGRFIVTPSWIRQSYEQRKLIGTLFFVQPFPSVLTDIVQKAGGSVVMQRPPLKRLLEYKEKGVKFVIITCDNDIHLCHSLIESGLDLHTAEFILTGILRQEVDYMSYRIEPRLNDAGKSGREL
ncbi:unnamed protein product [Soboliphyme baturini]|uniref:PAX-interacting protein 1 n=1 Tax=Soboliphyme baturini TaxID=241478 RepID=A0A183J199_9BILA|nr:unnamed protein product [Soboliphyme baturini]